MCRKTESFHIVKECIVRDLEQALRYLDVHDLLTRIKE